MMDKLLGFVGIGEGPGQYETTLSADLWDPTAFPAWAYRGELRKKRDKVSREKEAQKLSGGRTSVEFVAPLTTTKSGASGAGAGGYRGDKRKTGQK